jgi:lambda family phage minor tail protein L
LTLLDAQLPSFGSIVTLYQIDTAIYGGGVIYLSPSCLENRTNIVFNGNTYTAFPIDAQGFEIESGKAPRPTFVVSNLQALLIGGINEYRGLQNCKFTRIRVRRNELDDITPTITDEFVNYDTFYINQITSQTSVAIEFELITAMELANRQQFPKNQMVNYCNHIYRRWDADTSSFVIASVHPCPYTGTQYFDEFNEVTTQALDRCSKTVGGCEARFKTAVPFNGFPNFSEA